VEEPARLSMALQALDWRAATIGAAALGVLLVLLFAAWKFAGPLTLLLAAIATALALAPLVARLERWLPRVAAVLLLYFVAFLILGGIGWLVIPALSSQAQEAVDWAPQLIDTVQQWINRWNPLEQGRVVDFLKSQLTRFAGAIASLPLLIVSATFQLVLIVTLSIYWLLALPGLRQFTLSFFPRDRREQVKDVLGEMGQAMGGYIRGTVIDATAIGLLTYIGLLVIGIEFPLVLALLAFVRRVVAPALPLVGCRLAGAGGRLERDHPIRPKRDFGLQDFRSLPQQGQLAHCGSS